METLITFKAIGTHWWINIYTELQEADKVSIDNELVRLTLDFENLYSRFIDNSLVSKLNRGEQLTNVPQDLTNMLNMSESVKQITEGHFDINVGSKLESLGYDSEYSFSENENIKNKIDLGGIGKGYLIDKVKDFLLQNNIKYFFINAGGDIFATSNFDKPIEFILENPLDSSQAIAKINVLNNSIAASSPVLRKWTTTNTNKNVHHLIDYKTGEPVNNIAGVFTFSNTAVNADLASTALFVSPQRLHSKIAEHLNVEYLVVLKDGTYYKSLNYPAILN